MVRYLLNRYRARRLLKWQERRDSALRDLAAEAGQAGRRPVFLDVGARGGVAAPWADLCCAGLVQGVAVEPDLAEIDRLRRAFPYLVCLPHALANETGRQTLFLTKAAGCSSLLRPHKEVLAEFEVSEYFDIVRTTEQPVVRFDELVLTGVAPAPDFVKLDVQGFEKNVLVGFGDFLDRVIGLELEGHFRPIYHGQEPASALIDWLRERGLILRDIRQQGPFEGEFIEANFLFSRRPSRNAPAASPLLRLWEKACAIQPSPAFVHHEKLAPELRNDLPES